MTETENGQSSLLKEEADVEASSPLEDQQIGDIGAMAIQQLTASQSAVSPSEEYEREMTKLEYDIKRQKESSVNAKTAITFDQLKRIHQIGKILGPAKEAFYDRICRAADIQRASLKNRLKQNKEKFEPVNLFGANGAMNFARSQHTLSVDSPVTDMPVFGFPSNQLNQLLLAPPDLSMMGGMEFKPQTFTRAPASMDNRSMTPVSMAEEDNVKIPVERVNELFQLGFTYEEVKEFNGLFEQFKALSKDVCAPSQLLTSFSNFISQSVPEPLKLICTTFNLLEMGYTRREMIKIVNKERRALREEIDDLDLKPPMIMKKSCVESELGTPSSD